MVKPVDSMFKIQRVVAHIDGDQWQIMVTPPAAAMQLPTQMVTLTRDQYTRYLLWQNGVALIQDALPELSASDREILLTGIGPMEFDDIVRELDDTDYRCNGDSKDG